MGGVMWLQPVWNHVNVKDLNERTLTKAPDGKVLLHLSGIHMSDKIDNVAVAVSWVTVTDEDGAMGPAPVIITAGVLVQGQTGSDVSFDVTEAVQLMDKLVPIGDVTVAYAMTQKNHSIHISEKDFIVEHTWFDVFDKKGNPVPQPRKPLPPPDTQT